MRMRAYKFYLLNEFRKLRYPFRTIEIMDSHLKT